eukprot:364771-Chlamydomonas_euryale.AAC.5
MRAAVDVRQQHNVSKLPAQCQQNASTIATCLCCITMHYVVDTPDYPPLEGGPRTRGGGLVFSQLNIFCGKGKWERKAILTLRPSVVRSRQRKWKYCVLSGTGPSAKCHDAFFKVRRQCHCGVRMRAVGVWRWAGRNVRGGLRAGCHAITRLAAEGAVHETNALRMPEP